MAKKIQGFVIPLPNPNTSLKMSLRRTRRAYNAFSAVSPAAAAARPLSLPLPLQHARQTPLQLPLPLPRQYPAVPAPPRTIILTSANGHYDLKVTNPRIDITGDGYAEILVAPPTTAAGVARATFTNLTPNLVMLDVDGLFSAYMPAASALTLIANGKTWSPDPVHTATILVT